MSIEQIINLWDKSKYKTIVIKTLPVVNHLGEVIYGTGYYHKDEILLKGGEIAVYDYLKQIYKESLFIYEDTDDYIVFREFYRKGDK